MVMVGTPEGNFERAITYYLSLDDMAFLEIPAGSFTMGSEGGEENESPAGTVEIAQPFLMGAYPVTQQEYESLTGANPSRYKGLQRPVECVSWEDANAFCSVLSQRTGRRFRLPTEAEWEYACRAGSTTAYYFGDDEEALDGYGVFGGNGELYTNPVGQMTPNGFGLYDMHGNVWEWCRSVYKPYPYRRDDGREDPQAPGNRVLRGGAWFNAASYCRSSSRVEGEPDGDCPFHSYGVTGFRVVVARE
jgi:formylglycine-generating enzyme required for sulfatase activity